MIALGVVLILLVVLVTIFAVVASGTISTGIALTGLGITISVSPLGLFLAGALSVILLGLGFGLVSRGARHTAGKRKELKELRKEHAAPGTKANKDRAGSRTDDSRSPEARSTTEDSATVDAKGGRAADSGLDDGGRGDGKGTSTDPRTPDQGTDAHPNGGSR